MDTYRKKAEEPGDAPIIQPLEPPIEIYFSDLIGRSPQHFDADLLKWLRGISEYGYQYPREINLGSKLDFYSSEAIKTAIQIIRKFNQAMDNYSHSEGSWILIILNKLSEYENSDFLLREKNEAKKKAIFEKIYEQRVMTRIYGRLLRRYAEEFKSFTQEIDQNLMKILSLAENKEKAELNRNKISKDTRHVLKIIIASMDELASDQIEQDKKDLNKAIMQLKLACSSLGRIINDLKKAREKYTNRDDK